MDEEEGEQFRIFDFLISFSFSGFGEGKIVIWTRLDSKEKTRILYRHSRWVSALSFSPDGRFLASAGCFGRELIIWSAEVNENR
jgi:WD40 repeat protein